MRAGYCTPYECSRGKVSVFMTYFLLQLFSYHPFAWIIFLAIAFAVARYSPWWCIFLGQFVIAIIIYCLDIHWVRTEMAKPDWDGTPDMDIIFAVGVLFRIVLINTVLLPVVILGLWLKRRRRISSCKQKSLEQSA
jgi:hypothetical protein